jgi:hypothetical protein
MTIIASSLGDSTSRFTITQNHEYKYSMLGYCILDVYLFAYKLSIPVNDLITFLPFQGRYLS